MNIAVETFNHYLLCDIKVEQISWYNNFGTFWKGWCCNCVSLLKNICSKWSHYEVRIIVVCSETLQDRDREP